MEDLGPSLTHFGTNSAVSFLTPPSFKPSKISICISNVLARHLEAASSYLERPGHLEAASSYLERPGHLEAASSYLERPGYLEPPQVISSGRDVSSRLRSLGSRDILSPLRMTRSAQDDSVRYETSHVLRNCKVSRTELRAQGAVHLDSSIYTHETTFP